MACQDKIVILRQESKQIAALAGEFSKGRAAFGAGLTNRGVRELERSIRGPCQAGCVFPPEHDRLPGSRNLPGGWELTGSF